MCSVVVVRLRRAPRRSFVGNNARLSRFYAGQSIFEGRSLVLGCGYVLLNRGVCV